MEVKPLMGRVPLCCFFPNEPLDNMVIGSMKTSNICFQRMKPDSLHDPVLYKSRHNVGELKPILSVKGLESFDMFRLVVVHVFPIVHFFKIKKRATVSFLFSHLNKRFYHCSSSNTPGNGPLSVGVGGLQKRRKHQEEAKGRIHDKSF